MTDTPMQGERGERGKQGDHGQPGDPGFGVKGDKGEKGEKGEVPVELQQEVHALNSSVTALASMMGRYPDREEVKREGRKRTVKALLFGVVLILIAQFLTLGTVSYCFLTPQPGDLHRPYCSTIPGYDRSLEDANARLARFELVLGEIENNKKLNREQQIRIAILESRLKETQADLERAQTRLRETRQRLTSIEP